MKVRFGILLLVSIAVRCAFGQDVEPEIRLRLLDAWSGKPNVGQLVSLIEATGEIGSGLSLKDIRRETSSKTDEYGVARFHLELPLSLRVLFSFTGGRGCPITDPHYKNQWSPEEILARGIVVPNWCEGKRWHNRFRWQDIKAKPGEIVMFGLPASRLQW